MSIAADPNRVRDIFKIQEKNAIGIYAMDLWLLGMPITIVLDDFIPINKEFEITEYAQVGKDGALWGPLFEKSAAKYLGMYEAINAGGGAHGIEIMTGSPSFSLNHEKL